MKYLCYLFCLLITQLTYAQQPIKLTDSSLDKKTVYTSPFQQKAPSQILNQKPNLNLPASPDMIWKQDLNPSSYHSNPNENSFFYHQSNGQELIWAKPKDNQFLYELGAATTTIFGEALIGLLR